MSSTDLAFEESSTRHLLAPWCEESDLPSSQLDKVQDVDAAFAIAVATDLLYVLSGRQYRSGRSIVRPVSIQSAYSAQSYLYPYSSMSGYGSAWGFAAGWAWSAIGMGWWQGGQDLSEVVLQAPIQRINRVLVDGADLGPWSPGAPNPNYVVYDRRRVVRSVDATGQNSGAWPWNQQLQLPVSMPGTWLFDYEWGRLPPPSGKAACIVLALEVALALSGSSEGKLPARVISIATQGVSTAVGDALAYIKEELSGIPLVDMFLQAVNPQRLRRRAVFLAPNSIQTRDQGSLPG